MPNAGSNAALIMTRQQQQQMPAAPCTNSVGGGALLPPTSPLLLLLPPAGHMSGTSNPESSTSSHGSQRVQQQQQGIDADDPREQAIRSCFVEAYELEARHQQLQQKLLQQQQQVGGSGDMPEMLMLMNAGRPSEFMYERPTMLAGLLSVGGAPPCTSSSAASAAVTAMDEATAWQVVADLMVWAEITQPHYNPSIQRCAQHY